MTQDQAAMAASRQFVTELITGTWKSQALYCAAKLELADHIADGSTSARALAAATGASEDGVNRLMRLLVAIGLFSSESHGGYGNTPLSLSLRKGPSSLRDMCLLYGEECYHAWGHAHDAISATTSGFRAAYGETFYAYLSRNEPVAKRFQNVMNAGSQFFDSVPALIGHGRGLTLVDIGGGGGELLATLLQADPQARGVFFDRDHMVPGARSLLSGLNLGARVDFISGDMFEGIPAGGDVYFFSRVFAGWSDEAIVSVLSNCRMGMKDADARAIVIDRLIRDDAPRVMPALWDLQLLMTIGGRLRTIEHFTSLLAKAGLAVEHIVELPADYSAIVAKAA